MTADQVKAALKVMGFHSSTSDVFVKDQITVIYITPYDAQDIDGEPYFHIVCNKYYHDETIQEQLEPIHENFEEVLTKVGFLLQAGKPNGETIT